MTVVHVVGARPNFMKVAPVMRGLDERDLPQRLVHTGQHYDAAMSDVFFTDLGLPQPDVNLGVGPGSHAVQTAALLAALEPTLVDLDPDLVLVYGDVNSTLAAALVASKLGIPLGHVEAGLRSFDRSMPEEINRVVTDVLADLLFTTSPEAMDNLTAEGIDTSRVHFVGNPMIDTLLANLDRVDPARVARDLGLQGSYGVVTLHRPSNVDDAVQARQLVAMLAKASALLPLVFPVHPRGRQALEAAGLAGGSSLRVVDPLGYLDFVSLVRGARVIITDSGGIQEETTILGVPCLTLRPNTERPITITHGTNRLVTTSTIDAELERILTRDVVHPPEPPALWDGNAGARIATIVDEWLEGRGARDA